MGRVIYQHPQPHACSPGWEEYEADTPEFGRQTLLRPIQALDGAVWECECGRTWVAYHDTRTGIMGARWRSEKRREKRRRTKRNNGGSVHE